MQWVVLVPVKPRRRGKTRLDLPPGVREQVVQAMVVDTVTAAGAAEGVARVVVVSSESWAFGLEVVPDGGGGLSAAAAAAARDVDGPVAVLAGDLPALRPADLGAALALAAQVPCGVVADTPGTGTVLLTALRGSELRPAYGEGSLARHVALGATDLTAALGRVPGLRRDVDVLADWLSVLELGVGAHCAGIAEIADLTPSTGAP